MNDLFNPRKNAIIESWDNTKIKYCCLSCFSIPDRLFCLWLKDLEKNRCYLRYECFECTKTIFKRKGYFNQFLLYLREQAEQNFPEIIPKKNLLFIANNFYFYFDE